MSASVFYLHGFASSGGSTKAGYFAERLSGHGISLRCPDFNPPDFRSLTMTRMLGQLSEELTAAGRRPRPSSVPALAARWRFSARHASPIGSSASSCSRLR
jgi:predicted esterase YcpF (UPF0227 family)